MYVFDESDLLHSKVGSRSGSGYLQLILSSFLISSMGNSQNEEQLFILYIIDNWFDHTSYISEGCLIVDNAKYLYL